MTTDTIKRHGLLIASIAIDAIIVALSYVVSYLLRFEGTIPPEFRIGLWHTLPVVIIIKLFFFYYFGLYRALWRYTGIVDAINIVKGATAASVAIILIVLFLFRFELFPRSVYLIDWGLTILLIGGIRAATRIYMNYSGGASTNSLATTSPQRKRLLIIGAGASGEKVVRELKDNRNVRLEPIGFLDDAPEKRGRTIHGVKVLGRINEIGKFSDLCDEILIAIPSAKSADMRRIVELCEQTSKMFRTLPSLGELIDGHISVNTIREVSLADILGRDEISLDQEQIALFLRDKRVLVTGAGGSIGSELVRQICRFKPGALGLLDFSEYNLYRIDLETRRREPDLAISTFLTDIRDREVLARTFADFRPDIVFHAAAYKHVPLQEAHPREAVIANVMGTLNVAYAAVSCQTSTFILVSTDKAVRPTNVMGATKRLAEMIVLSLNGNHTTRFMAVRFGNVIGSSGSVIPLFQEQIARGGPVTVTHPEVVRYFMSIPEAAQLILQAGSMGEGGEIFILDMGEPIKIIDIARDLIRLHGLQPDVDIPIEFIGLRPGEKLYEELITDGEGITQTSHKKVFVLRGMPPDAAFIDQAISRLLAATQTFDDELIVSTLRSLIDT